MAYVGKSSATPVLQRPDRPLIVKCEFNRSLRPLQFPSARDCSYHLLRTRIERRFALSASSFNISYEDDDGETTDVVSDEDLTDAIQYFQAGEDDERGSVRGSVYSGYSGRITREITLRLSISVEYDGPSLSDTASLASLDDFPKHGRNSRYSSDDDSFSRLSGSLELEDDAVTISSRDTPSHAHFARNVNLIPDLPARYHEPTMGTPRAPRSGPSSHFMSSSSTLAVSQPPVLERLKSAELQNQSASNSSQSNLHSSDRSAQWLREQNVHVIRQMLGASPAPSDTATSASGVDEADDLSAASSLRLSRGFDDDYDEDDVATSIGRGSGGGALALQKDPRGKYYYAYTSDLASSFSGGDEHPPDEPGSPRRPSPVTRRPSMASSPPPTPPTSREEDDNTLSPELLQAILQADTHEHEPSLITSCSSCGDNLDSFRYICSTCGEKKPHLRTETNPFKDPRGGDKSSERNRFEDSLPSPPASSSSHEQSEGDIPSVSATQLPTPSSRGWGFNAGSIRLNQSPVSSSSAPGWNLFAKPSSADFPLTVFRTSNPPSPVTTTSQSPPLSSPHVGETPPLPHSASSSSSISIPPQETGYELCATCIQTAGVIHAEGALNYDAALPSASVFSTNPSSPISGISGIPPSNPTYTSSSSSASGSGSMSGLTGSDYSLVAPPRRVKRKGQIRHAYVEKIWSPDGWKTVELEDECSCSICAKPIERDGFKCVSCESFNLCRACYSQVHEIHPSHAFLSIPDKLVPAPPEPAQPDQPEHHEASLKHPEVTCHHCLQDIVGARFHCALCDNVDICSNCDSAGLPGNLTSPDGGHDSSHIMIKIPVPLALNEVQTASRRARALWTGRDSSIIEGAGHLHGSLDHHRDSLHHHRYTAHHHQDSLRSHQDSLRQHQDALRRDRDASQHHFNAYGSHHGSTVSHGRRVRRDSFDSAYAETIIGSSSGSSRTRRGAEDRRRRGPVGPNGYQGSRRHVRMPVDPTDHGVRCSGCDRAIVGTRYQCATCSSFPTAYNLCDDCERISFTIHDAMHVFFKIPRRVDRPIAMRGGVVAPVYDVPAGRDRDGNYYGEDFEEYLQTIEHTSAACDRCIELIKGKWYRCANCNKDFCEDCEGVDVHDATHVFLVFKSSVSIDSFLREVPLSSDGQPKSLLGYTVYSA